MKTTSVRSAPVAVVTGASRGLGRAVAVLLAERGWQLVLDARSEPALLELAAHLPAAVAIAGDVADATHRIALHAAATGLGHVDLLVNNASELGPSPLPALADYPLEALRQVVEVNLIAPLALIGLFLPMLRTSNGVVANVTSDAAVEPYPGWGGYGASKAALEQVSAVLGAEESTVRVYAVDPGDMRTQMHQLAFPGEDISDRPEPGAVAPRLLRLLDARPVSGRYRLDDWRENADAPSAPAS